ncbi:hypothetical protein B0H14DRAFT_3092502 [Mycena olivaceomarginata]|nr:hypothetical protein B0H14DRAFT_3092502 [Mycena olivaceomarginata]
MRNRGNRASEDQTQRANSPVDDVGLALDSIPFESDLPVQPDLAVPEPSDQDAQIPTADSGAADSRLPNGLPRWSEQLDPRLLARATHGPGKTFFEIIHDEEILKDGMVLGPFRDNDEWELAKWLIKYVGHMATQEFLKLPIISERASPSYTGKTDFFGKIDSLPSGVNDKLSGSIKWHCKTITTTKDPTSKTMKTETVELWFRDPVECVAELIGNPMFKDAMWYAPEKLFMDEAGTDEVVNEMWTAQWWWEIQKRLPPGCTIAPLIFSSDKTMLSNFRGDNSAWPMYLTIGNIGKETRREVSAHATILVGYLPIPKFDCFDKNTKALAKYRLFHKCISIIMQSVIAAGTSGRKMVCTDSLVRDVWPIFAAYVADYPEQCLRGNHESHPFRDLRETLFFMKRQQVGEKDTVFEETGVRTVYPPFWADLPHSDIFQSFTPDLLHQLHKGVFKDLLVKWCTEIIGQLEIDTRFKAMLAHPGVRHFKNGISTVSQWTGMEHKEMEKVFLGLIAAGAHPEMVKAVRGLIDFVYFASLQSHTSATLMGLQTALDLTMLMIRLFGSADGFNTESPERLHIDYAKNAYRASNRKDYVNQMTLWLTRQESVARFSHYLEWGHRPSLSPATTEPVASASASSNEEADSLIITHSYSIAKAPPPATRAVAANHIMSPDRHNASRFLPALTHFLRQAGSNCIPRHFDMFGTWKRIRFKLPTIPAVGSRHSSNIVRATAPIPASPSNRKAAEPAFLRTNISWVTCASGGEMGPTLLLGLRVAQVKTIFKLPAHYPYKTTSPLAYIEWFTPLRTPDSVDGYYHISRSTRQQQPSAEIITADRIVRNAMLIPQKWGHDKTFLLNSHSDAHAFCLYKLGYHNCLPE